MELLTRGNTDKNILPIRVVQFGDGNFLRGFVDYLIDLSNKEGTDIGVAVVKSRPGPGMEALIKQQGLYTLFIEGILNGNVVKEQHVIECLQAFINPYDEWEGFLQLAEGPELKLIVSNTTEAGIAFDEADSVKGNYPYKSFPAKLTAFLYHRFRYYKGSEESGLVILPCELIETNATVLKNIVLQYARLWDFGPEFEAWVNNCNCFYNTLVDRIVSGYPKNNADAYLAKMPYQDKLITVSEPYLFWAVENGEALKDIFSQKILSRYFLLTPDIHPYRIRKVRILNGAHTILAQVGRLCGILTVGESMNDAFVNAFLQEAIKNEILPTIPLPKGELREYTNEIMDRFKNPYLEHQLRDIALNSVSKFQARLLPVMVDYYTAFNKLPIYLTYTLACLIRLYKVEWNGSRVELRDSEQVLQYFSEAWSNSQPEDVVDYIVNNLDFTQDILPLTVLKNILTEALQNIEEFGIVEGFDVFKHNYVI